MSNRKYFSGTQEVKDVFYVIASKQPELAAIGAKLGGYPLRGVGVLLPVTRIIDFKSRPSLHQCDARCRNARGKNCECECGGQFHGAGA